MIAEVGDGWQVLFGEKFSTLEDFERGVHKSCVVFFWGEDERGS